MSFKKTQRPVSVVGKAFYASAFVLGAKKRGGEAQFEQSVKVRCTARWALGVRTALSLQEKQEGFAVRTGKLSLTLEGRIQVFKLVLQTEKFLLL